MSQTAGRPIASMTEDEIPQLRNLPVYAQGEEIGHVGDIYYDEERRTVECVGVSGGLLGMKRQWVPAQGAMLADDGLHLDYGRQQLDDAPRWEDEDNIDSDRYQQVRDHFVRHEEELAVAKEERTAGAVRLRKWVETQPVTAEVELQRETAHVTREPVDQPTGGDHAFEEQEVEIPLHAEKAVVQKQTVAKERIGIEKDVETTTQTVSDEVRKERVEVDGDNQQADAR